MLRKKADPPHALFRPPRVFLGDNQLVVPLVHPNRNQMRMLRRVLDGGGFYVKAMGPVKKMFTGDYFLLAKLKPFNN